MDCYVFTRWFEHNFYSYGIICSKSLGVVFWHFLYLIELSTQSLITSKISIYKLVLNVNTTYCVLFATLWLENVTKIVNDILKCN